MDYTKEQIKAAYALNLCTVSVSQIIDYADINIMEQEYEAILNNLNIEQMPKDEALLKILKQIMDTITYFRIQEGDKQFIDREYQQKMKNAIWSAVPNIGMIVAGGNPVSMAVSLASQVGIGYMNYRRAKADGMLERDRARWELERGAIEQFNGLRRELFDTAWRLSAEYDFPDQLRLTERQIHQYNNILMDNDLIRKLERLYTIQESFIAYPPFWYQMGNTANALARSNEYLLDDVTRDNYLQLAKNSFIHYRTVNQHGLLREDPVSSACALELADLLDRNTEKELIMELLTEAIQFSGRRNDILQLVSVAYLKLNEIDAATNIISQLVNEQYNTNLNAQLLSSIYVSTYIKTQSAVAKTKYNILSQRLGNSVLYPMPKTTADSIESIESDFLQTQQKILLSKYIMVLNKFRESYSIKFGRIIPVPDSSKRYNYSYFLSTDHAIQNRKDDLANVFKNNHRSNDYKYRLQDIEFSYRILELLNDLFKKTCHLDLMSSAVQDKLFLEIEHAILDHRQQLNEFEKKIFQNQIDLSDMENALDLSWNVFTKTFFEKLHQEIITYIQMRTEMQDFALAEQNLLDFCDIANLPAPSVLYDNRKHSEEILDENDEHIFSSRLLRGEGSHLSSSDQYLTNMISIISKNIPMIVLDGNQVAFYTEEDPRVERYFNSNTKLPRTTSFKAQILAILDIKHDKGTYDLLFTNTGIIPVKNGSSRPRISYHKVNRVPLMKNTLIIDGYFSNDAIDMGKLYDLCQSLAGYSQHKPSHNTNHFKLPDIKLPDITSVELKIPNIPKPEFKKPDLKNPFSKK